MWRNGSPHALLVGLQTGVATVKNGMEFPQKIKEELFFKKKENIEESNVLKRLKGTIIKHQNILQICINEKSVLLVQE